MNIVRFNNPFFNNFEDNLFNNFFSPEEKRYYSAKNCANTPATNIYESENSFHLDLLIPGFDKEEVKISLDKNYLVIKGELRGSEDKNMKFSNNEFTINNFERRFKVSEKINGEKISAKFKNGVLSIELPLKADEKEKVSRNISIE